MSQEQLAEAIFVSRQTISNWETDRTYPDVQSLLLLSNLFGVSVDDLIKGDVEEMKAVLTNEAKKLNGLSVVMMVCGAAAVVWAVATALLDASWPVILVPFAALFVPAAVAAGMAEKIKHDNQLFTYRAIEAFMRGEDPDVASEANRKAGRAWWASSSRRPPSPSLSASAAAGASSASCRSCSPSTDPAGQRADRRSSNH